MKTLFPGYYRPSEQDFERMWQEGIFALDANMLLNIYRYTPETQKSFFEVLEKITDRIWIPHQVAYEYQVQRLNVISTQEKTYEQIENLLDDILKRLENGLNSYRKHTFIDVNRLLKSVEKEFDRTKKGIQTVKAKHPKYFDADPLRDRITELFEGKVGNSYNEKELEEFYKKAEKRFTSSPPIPPGFADVKNKGVPQKYGDTIIWFQLLDYAKQSKKPMFLITDEKKEDWWFIHEGKTVGPRPELIQEMMSVAGISFYMYSGHQFLAYAQKFFGIKDQEGAIEEAKEIREQDEAKEYLDAAALVSAEVVWHEGSSALPAAQFIREVDNSFSNNLVDQVGEMHSNPSYQEAIRQAKELVSNPSYQEAVRQMIKLEKNPAHQAAMRQMREMESNPAYKEAIRQAGKLASNSTYQIMRDLIRRGLL